MQILEIKKFVDLFCFVFQVLSLSNAEQKFPRPVYCSFVPET